MSDKFDPSELKHKDDLTDFIYSEICLSYKNQQLSRLKYRLIIHIQHMFIKNLYQIRHVRSIRVCHYHRKCKKSLFSCFSSLITIITMSLFINIKRPRHTNNNILTKYHASINNVFILLYYSFIE
jgi:hypothetical protein